MGADFYPRDAGVALFGVTVTLCTLSTIIVVLRMMVRVHNKALGLDDYLMVFGLVGTISNMVDQVRI